MVCKLLLSVVFPPARALCSVVCELVCLSLRPDLDRRPSFFEPVLEFELELELELDSLRLPFVLFVFVFLGCGDLMSSSKVTFRFLSPFAVDFGLVFELRLGIELGIVFSNSARSIGRSGTKSHSEPVSVLAVLAPFLLGLDLKLFFDLSNSFL